jgi:hypothetical protein
VAIIDCAAPARQPIDVDMIKYRQFAETLNYSYLLQRLRCMEEVDKACVVDKQ